MATLFIIVFHMSLRGEWKISEAYQSRPDQAALCNVARDHITSVVKPRPGERIRVFCQAEPPEA